MGSYSSSIVAMCLSCTISEILSVTSQNLKRSRQLFSYLCQMLNDFENSFKNRLSNKFAIKYWSKVPLHLNHVATLRCNILLSIMHVSGCCCLSDINISQGSVAPRLRRGGIVYYRFARNLLLSLSVKEFRKSSAFGKLRGKNTEMV